MSTSKLAVAVSVVLLLGVSPVVAPLEAQFGSNYISASQPYQTGTKFTPHTDWASHCIWYGQEPDGAVVYAFEAQSPCNGIATSWSYDLDGDRVVELNAWPQRLPYCGVQIRAWQWLQNGKFFEYVRGDCVYMRSTGQYQYVYNYFSNAAGVPCAEALSGLDARRRAAQATLQDAMAKSPNDLRTLKRLWHNFNQANLTYTACHNFLTPPT